MKLWHFVTICVVAFWVLLFGYWQVAQPAELEATGELTTGWSNVYDNPFVGVHLSGRINGFTLYGGSRIDLRMSEIQDYLQPSFGPMRSVYSMGLKYEWRFLEVGWRHECTHRGDYATYSEWVDMRKPNEDDLYIIFRFTTGAQ